MYTITDFPELRMRIAMSRTNGLNDYLARAQTLTPASTSQRQLVCERIPTHLHAVVNPAPCSLRARAIERTLHYDFG